MRLFLFLFVVLSLAACSKGPELNNPPAATDTLGVGWRKIPLPTANAIGDIFFIDNATGFCIDRRSVFRSTDGGENWQKVYQSENSLWNIGMGNANNIVITSLTDRILVTRNGGNSFDSTSLPGDPHVSDVFFVSPSIAYAVGNKTWKTVNAGMSWTALSLFDPDPSLEKACYFINEQKGWLTGSGFLRTMNGGINWQQGNLPGSGLGSIGFVYFLDANNGYITDPGSVIKTSDGGVSFTKIFRTNNSGYHDIHFVSQQTGYVIDDNYIWKTSDGGQTWTKDVQLKTDRLIELHFTDAAHGWAAGPPGFILKYEQ